MGDEGGGGEFNRVSHKFWVPLEQLPYVKRIIEGYLPPYFFKGITDNLIQSIYLDSNSMIAYRQRIIRKEGSELIRIRNYGSGPRPDTHKVFFERKKHLKSWKGLSSLKQRFTSRISDVPAIMEGRMIFPPDYDPQVKQLAIEVQDAIKTQGLRASIRTYYNRLAYQNGEDLSFRISIDDNLTFIKESTNLRDASTINWDLDFARLSNQECVRFTYAVMEVKLQRKKDEGSVELPSWVNSLIEQDYIYDMPKFSKFLTASALFRWSEVNEIPSWFTLLNPEELLNHSHPCDVTPYIPPSIKGIHDEYLIESYEEEKKEPTGSLNPHTAPDAPASYVEAKKLHIDPKLYMANERTYVRWTNICLTVTAIGGGLLHATDLSKSTGLDLIMTAVGMCLVIRAYYVWRKRNTYIQSQRTQMESFSDMSNGYLMLAYIFFVFIVIMINGI